MDYCTGTEKRSRQTRDWSKKVVYRDGRIRIATGIASTLKHPLKNPSHQQHDHPLCTILHQARRQGPLPTDVTTTRSTRKPDHCWRQWWGIRWMRQQLLYSNFLYAGFFPFTLSRMWRSNTQIFWMSTIYLWSLLQTSTDALSVWLSKILKLVTSTIVGDIVMISLTCVQHVFAYPFSFMIKHAFYLCLPHFYIVFYMCSPQGKHISLSI